MARRRGLGSSPAQTEAAQQFSITRRALVLGGLQGGAGLMLAARMGYLSIFEQERYKLLAESNRVALQLVPPRRGWIVDRTGKPLALNRPDFQLQLIPEQSRDVPGTIRALAELLKIPPDDLARIEEEAKAKAGFQPIQIAHDLDWDQFAAINVRLTDFPGVVPVRGYARIYPTGPAVAHLLGYVGAATADQYRETKNPLLIFPGFKVGKDGLEKTLDQQLIGKAGAARVEVNARGRPLRNLDTIAATPGETVRLTIDAGLQDYAARRMGDQSGSVVVLDCANGDILAMTSMPAYDPNAFSGGISNRMWSALRENDHLPLLNKTLQGLYPPGSTFKPVTALALLENGVAPEDAVVCTGRYRLGDSYFHCWKHGGHGVTSMRKALYQSCDVYFYHFGRQIGIDAIAATARKLGLGAEYDLPVPSQRYGTVPDSAWKQRKYGKPWLQGETLSAAIGQGYTLANPLQLAVMATRIASGRALNPHLLLGARGVERTLDIDPAHLQFLHEAMGDVVNSPGGTAGSARLRVPGIDMAGKTGSAQVRRITMAERARGVLRDESLPWRLRDHALFVCFAPVENPRYAAAVVIEHGSHGGSAAAPIARDVLTYLFDPDAAMKTLAALEKQWGGDIVTRMKSEAAARAAQQAAAEEATSRTARDSGRPSSSSSAKPAPAATTATAARSADNDSSEGEGR